MSEVIRGVSPDPRGGAQQAMGLGDTPSASSKLGYDELPGCLPSLSGSGETPRVLWGGLN